jgi:Ser/Thr protein kinase RdoA (MazF antagonist)
MGPPATLVAHWVGAGVVAPGATWRALPGGNTNRVWRIEAPIRDAPALVCKLYRPGGDTPLFRNDPAAEATALRALAGTGLAPAFVAAAETAAGRSLAYAHVAGRAWRPEDAVASVAAALARLHAVPAPPELPAFLSDEPALRAQTRDMLAMIGAAGQDLARIEPPAVSAPDVTPVFVHGDATAGNVLIGAAGVTFIDWQCPGRGDPAGDLAVFLSPGMQAICGNPPLSTTQAAAFLAAYGNPATVARYNALRPLFHWRMAAYCLWRAARGDDGYTQAAALEIAALRG